MEGIKRGPRVAGRRDVNRMLSFLPLSSIHSKTARMPPTHPTATTPQPSGGTLEPLWFALSYCMRHERRENYSGVIVPLGVCLLNKKIFSGGNGRNSSLRKTAFVLTKCSLGMLCESVFFEP